MATTHGAVGFEGLGMAQRGIVTGTAGFILSRQGPTRFRPAGSWPPRAGRTRPPGRRTTAGHAHQGVAAAWPRVSERTASTIGGDRLVLGEGLHPAGHRVDRDVGARHEREREHEQRHPLRGLGVAGHEPDGMNSQVNAKPKSDAQPEGGQRRRPTLPWSRNPTAKPMAVGDDQDPGQQPGVGQRPAGEHRQRGGSGSERSRSRNPRRGPRRRRPPRPMPENSTLVTTKPGTRKST